MRKENFRLRVVVTLKQWTYDRDKRICINHGVFSVPSIRSEAKEREAEERLLRR